MHAHKTNSGWSKEKELYAVLFQSLHISHHSTLPTVDSYYNISFSGKTVLCIEKYMDFDAGQIVADIISDTCAVWPRHFI